MFLCINIFSKFVVHENKYFNNYFNRNGFFFLVKLGAEITIDIMTLKCDLLNSLLTHLVQCSISPRSFSTSVPASATSFTTPASTCGWRARSRPAQKHNTNKTFTNHLFLFFKIDFKYKFLINDKRLNLLIKNFGEQKTPFNSKTKNTFYVICNDLKWVFIKILMWYLLTSSWTSYDVNTTLVVVRVKLALNAWNYRILREYTP